MKKWVVGIIVLFLFAFKANGQTYTQTFIDKCTGEKKVATTTIINGHATVSFYNQIRTFTPLEVQTGVVQTWLFTTKATYEALTCPVINNPVVQQAVANTATQAAANAASSAASSAASAAASSSASAAASSSASSAAASSAASTPPPTTPPPSNGSSTPPPASGSSSQSGGSSSSSSSQSSGSSSQSKTETKSESKTETKSESKSESKSETKSEEKKEETKSESKEEKKEESKSEEKKEEKKEEEKKEEKKKEKAAPSNPMLLSSDLSTIESPDGRWLQSATIGVSRASMAGDESYSATAVVMSDLKTFIVSGGYTKMDFSNGKLNAVHSYSSGFAYLNGTYMNLLGYTWVKPTEKRGVFGYNTSVINLFIKNTNTNQYDFNLSTSLVAFWTKPYQYSKKLSVSPQIFTMFSPIGWNSREGTSTVNRHMGFLLGTTFDYKITKRFGFTVNYRLSGNTTPGSPFLSNILIGSRMIL